VLGDGEVAGEGGVEEGGVVEADDKAIQDEDEEVDKAGEGCGDGGL